MLGAELHLVYASGDCEIDLARRELRILGSPVPVGGRAFEMIEVLARSGGELVTKDQLMDRIWPGAVVMENTLHVHTAAVRKALGPYRELLKTESRRGYRLLGNWTARHQDAAAPPVGLQKMRPPGESPGTNLPVVVTPLVGRSAAVRQVRDLVSAYRVVTLTGPGGIGKTSLAVKAARRIVGDFADGIWLVELASLSDPALVPSAVAQVLRLRLGGGDITAEAVARAVGGQHILLLLDNCEHVIDAAASLAEMLVRQCPHVTILATSREVFRIQGESVYRVLPLEVPASNQLEADQILGHSAPALFIARATQLGSDFSAQAENLPAIAAICRHLDGIPLAIEFAAARAATLGIAQVATGLRDRFALLTGGRRTALPRHRTLRATLDWSYELLPDVERRLLLRLGIFSGGFSLAAVCAVTNRGDAADAEIVDGVANLVAKSLVTPDFTEGASYFRLLETTRVYALARLTEAEELQEFSRRHAEYYRGLLGKIDDAWQEGATHLADVDNVRAALEWCFGVGGDLEIGVGLAAAAAPVFLAMSLLPECHRWSERALSALDATARGGREEMHLQAGLGTSLMNMHGGSDAARAALNRSLAIAEDHGDIPGQMGLLGMLHMFHLRGGDFNNALHFAKRSSVVAGGSEDPASIAFAHSTLGRALLATGDLGGARMELEASLLPWSRPLRTGTIYLAADRHYRPGVALARTLWLQGFPDQAVERTRQTIADVGRLDHPVSMTGVLTWVISVFVWTGDLRTAEQHADWLISYAESHSLRPNVAVGRGLKGVLAILRDDAESGVEILQACLRELHEARYELLTTEFNIMLAQGLAATNRFAEGSQLIDESIQQMETSGDLACMPELLRVKGNLLLAMPSHSADEAEPWFMRSLELSRRQGMRGWELRTAVDLAALLAQQGRRGSGRILLQPVYEQFTEGLDTADLKNAERLLATLD